MESMSKSAFSQLTVEKAKELLPLILTSEGEPFAVLSNPDDVLVLTGIHPFMKNKLKNLEHIARQS